MNELGPDDLDMVGAQLYSTFIVPVEQDIGLDGEGTVDCITWTGDAESALEQYTHQLPKDITIFHCTYSGSDTHHWLELEFHNFEGYIWDGSRQKLQGGTTFIKKTTPNLWHGFSSPGVTRQQIYPEIIE